MNKNGFLLSVRNLSKGFPLPQGGVLQVLNDVRFSVKKGQNCAIVGSSGSGKSTFLNIISGMDMPDAGDIFIEQDNISRIDSNRLSEIRNKKIGYVFQFFNLMPELNVIENIALPLVIKGQSIKSAFDKAMDLLERFTMQDKCFYSINRLSGGEMQRVAIMRAIINEPLIVLADEPTGNLDSHTAKDVLSFLFKAVRFTEGALITVTHDMEIAGNFELVYELKEGRLREVCP